MGLHFPFNYYLLALLGGFAGTMLTTPLWRKWCLKNDLMDAPGHRKIHSHPIPLAGGLGVLTGIVVPLMGSILWVLLVKHFEANPGPPHLSSLDLLSHGWRVRGFEMASILVGALGAFFLGWFDDRIELNAAWKFSGQLLIALLVASAGVRITLFIPNLWFNYGITILWFVTVMNAFNFIDNSNGLCGGLSAIGGLFIASYSALSGEYLVGCIAFLVAGSFLGFLPHNFPKARVFLGDSGSHLAGYLLAVLAVLPHFYNPHRLRRAAVLAPLLFLAVPLADLASVVIIRWRLKKPFYQGDNNHFSHRLMRRGFSPAKAVMLLWAAAGFIGAFAFFWTRTR